MSRPNCFPDQGIRSAELRETRDGALHRIPLRLPEPGAKVLLADEPVAARPRRSCAHSVPVHVVAVAPIEERERHRVCAAECWECGAPLGTLILERDTLFGAAEDARVLRTGRRGRVYDGTGGET